MSLSNISNLETSEGKAVSPTSSIASHNKPLEWDSGADVGYEQRISTFISTKESTKFSTLERMVLAHGCSTDHRLDPEGKTENQQLNPVLGMVKKTDSTSLKVFENEGKLVTEKFTPNCNSTLEAKENCNHELESNDEMEITPIVKNYLSGIPIEKHKNIESIGEIKSKTESLLEIYLDEVVTKNLVSTTVVKTPFAISNCNNPLNIGSKTSYHLDPIFTQITSSSDTKTSLKKSVSMNVLASPPVKLYLTRSQSDLNLSQDRTTSSKLTFNSTSSIATVVTGYKVNPSTCNKLVQTVMKPCLKESIGVQVSVMEEEENKPPYPERATSLISRSLSSLLKTSKNTLKVPNLKSSITKDIFCKKDFTNEGETRKIEKDGESSTDSSQNISSTPFADDTENILRRVNSFEYFPGHIYENVPNGSTSHVSSIDTGRCSNSTMPNTSSSLDEKLWGDSNSLIKDLERSINILKGLLDANKLDMQVKKRLIHHVVKRLVNAKYLDDKIEHNLEENVPWNPDNVNRVYRSEIIQALAKNTTDSSEDWEPFLKIKNKKKITEEKGEMKRTIINKFDKVREKLVIDGRKARMGLYNPSRNSRDSPTTKSESSDCFLSHYSFNGIDKTNDVFLTPSSHTSAEKKKKILNTSVRDSDGVENWDLSNTKSGQTNDHLDMCSNIDMGNTKIISYTEMEKNNQLLWITNEISHLSNLKKLLEQTGTKSYKSLSNSKVSARLKKPLIPAYTSAIQNPEGAISINKDWTSHGNLATFFTSVDTIKKTKKRNSCTQTLTNISSACSKTGCEIVSAKILSSNINMANASCQTSKFSSLIKATEPVTQDYKNYWIYSEAEPINCIRCERLSATCNTENIYSHHTWLFNANKKNCLSQCQPGYNFLEKGKKTMQHVEAIKYNYDTAINKKQAINTENVTSEIDHSSQQSQGCYDSSKKKKIHKFMTNQYCYQGGNYEKDLENRIQKLKIGKSSKKTLFEKNTNENCTCDLKNIENQTVKSQYNFNDSIKTLPSNMIAQKKESHNNSHGKVVEGIGKLHSCSMESTHPKIKGCMYSSLSGSLFQYDRKSCLKNYPRSEAYELSFIDNNNSAGKVNIEIKKINKNTKLEQVIKIKENCNCKKKKASLRLDVCDCKKNPLVDSKFTLQNYLVSKNPGFADNVETRRQYVSELQHLRKLRKDRRIQLLAMATTTKECVRKKILDKEMKMRLQKKYSQFSEVRARRIQQRLQEETRRNKLMAKIFCKKLQQKVLNGQVDLSQSISVISNL